MPLPKNKVPSPAGTLFLVPLTDHGYVRGLITHARRSQIRFGYFFGPRLAHPEEASESGISPTSFLTRCMFSALGLTRGEWPIFGRMNHKAPSFSSYILPPLSLGQFHDDRGTLTTYNSKLDEVSYEIIDIVDIFKYSRDGLSGCVAMQITLTQIMNTLESTGELPPEHPIPPEWVHIYNSDGTKK